MRKTYKKSGKKNFHPPYNPEYSPQNPQLYPNHEYPSTNSYAPHVNPFANVNPFENASASANANSYAFANETCHICGNIDDEISLKLCQCGNVHEDCIKNDVKCKKCGAKYDFVEQEICNAKGCFEILKFVGKIFLVILNVAVLFPNLNSIQCVLSEQPTANAAGATVVSSMCAVLGLIIWHSIGASGYFEKHFTSYMRGYILTLGYCIVAQLMGYAILQMWPSFITYSCAKMMPNIWTFLIGIMIIFICCFPILLYKIMKKICCKKVRTYKFATIERV